MNTIAEIRARIEAAPTSSAGDPDWLADAKVLLERLETSRAARDVWCDKFVQERELTRGHLEYIAALEAEIAKLKAAPNAWGEPVWRPIETYKNHFPVLVSCKVYTQTHHGPTAAFRDVTGVWRVYLSEGGMSPVPFDPTHWQPLPTPPTEAQSAPPPPTDREKRLVEALTEIENAPNEMDDPDATYMQLIAHDALESYRNG